MKTFPQDVTADRVPAETHPETISPPRPRLARTRPPLPEDYKELCALCRAGKLFAVQEWFKNHPYIEPERCDCRHWPIGIAIEKGFHSLAEVLLQNGVPADGRALQRAAEYRNRDLVELMFRFGADVNMVGFEYIVSIGEPQIVRLFIERGADLVDGFPIARGLIRLTRPFLGIYKAYIDQRPELQFQADMALRHFCEKGNMRGVSLLMWLGANPRAKVPLEAGDSDEMWNTPLEAAASSGQLDVVKRLKPHAARDDLNQLLGNSLFCENMELVRYWVSLGADLNHSDDEGAVIHRRVMWNLNWALDSRLHWYGGRDGSAAKRFAREWFSAGAKWTPRGDDLSSIRKVLSRLSYMDAYEFIKLLIEKKVMPADSLGEILDTPKLRKHLKERRAAIAALVPRMQKWIKAEERKRVLENARQAAARVRSRQASPPRAAVEQQEIWKDPRNVRRLSDE